MNLSNLSELAGVLLVVVAVTGLAGGWWGALVAGLLLVAYGVALDREPPPGGDA